MKLLERIAAFGAGLTAWLAGAVMLLMMLQITLDVVCKYLFNWPIPMTLETVATYYMVALVFLPLGQVTRKEDHLEVELFTQNLGPRALGWVKLFGCLIGLAYVGILCNEAIDEALKMTRRGEVWETATMDLQVWPTRWFLPVGGVLMLLWLFLHAVDSVAVALTGRHVLSETDPHGPISDPDHITLAD
ncbi:TRAP transporter small permease [Albimonas pacifica]|uniref:TRAP transporter small permease protein n=1 Tax=Albimonas pacifica TaxID=1114924 RepID=A0A1I3P445_9RHOB|nr:TRAP transporter small permease [Albimonas pacifica]SFJ16304.1 TRAP-type mannitol/chloroaromatic compound transport system, small permease component [Albimonas pacifica]